METTTNLVHPWLVESPCDGCRALPGRGHNEGCDHELCVATGRQYWVCTGEFHEEQGRGYGEHEGGCGGVIWDGVGPTGRAAGLRGWYAECVPGQGWVGRSEAEALADPKNIFPDLNRVVMSLTWDPESASFQGH